jgi:hypothetical protein
MIALMGGLFAVLAFIHFFVDWIFQSHAEAMVKHNNPYIRAKHCLIYTLGFTPLFWLVGFGRLEWMIGLNILFLSHFIEDTYWPVFLWAKYIRRPPEMTQPRKQVGFDGYVAVLPPDAKAGFMEFVQTPLGKILMIAIDQIIHLFFLFPIAWMILSHITDDFGITLLSFIRPI